MSFLDVPTFDIKKMGDFLKVPELLILAKLCCSSYYPIFVVDSKVILLAVGSRFEKKNGNKLSKCQMSEPIRKHQM